MFMVQSSKGCRVFFVETQCFKTPLQQVKEYLHRNKDRDTYKVFVENGGPYRFQKGGNDVFPRWQPFNL